MVPVWREFLFDTDTAVTAYAKLARPPFGFLLESLVGGERWARYTFVGTEPTAAWRYRAGRAERWTRSGGWGAGEPAPDPLAHIAAQVRPRRVADVAGLPRFVGGAVGYLGYDVVRAFERLGPGPADDLALPDALFLLVETVLIVDNAFGRALVVTTVEPPSGGDAAVRAAYDGALHALKPRFDLYERANQVNDHPWLADLLIWRAQRSPRILRRMAGVLEEKGNPGNLVSLRGITRLFLPIR